MKLKFKFFSVLVLIGAIQAVAAEPDWMVFDQSINALMAKHHIPGVSLAVARNGKLVIARAYGLADRERNIPVQPDSRFRIASISKTFTAAAILKLTEEGRLNLDAKVFSLLDQIQPPPGKRADPRLANITVRQLLQHTGGWDRDISGDIVGMIPEAARALKVPAPVGPDDLIRYVMGRRLDFDPGSRFAYSNIGYLLLGRAIEKITRMPYEDYVKEAILTPIGAHRMLLGHSLAAQRADGEVAYYDVPGAPLVWTFVRGGSPVVPAPYANPMETFNSCGGWLASAIDLVRFALALDEQSGRELLLKPDTFQQMRGDRIPAWVTPATQHLYALGLAVDVAADGGETWWHTGGMAGTASGLVHRPDGIVYAVLFNSLPGGEFGDIASVGDAHDAITAALDSIREWPDVDLFESFQ